MTYVSADRFRAAARHSRKDVSGLLVRKLSAVAPELADDTIRFTITTAGLDRDNDVISVDGWDTGAYLRCPVVLWGHDTSEPPVGRAARLFREGDTIKADVEFVPADVPLYGPRAQGIKALCQGGFLFASSVGFRPLEWAFTEDKARGADDWLPGIDFHRQELCEFSIVSVPANPEALLVSDDMVSVDEPVAANDTVAIAAAAGIARRKRYRQHIAKLYALAG